MEVSGCQASALCLLPVRHCVVAYFVCVCVCVCVCVLACVCVCLCVCMCVCLSVCHSVILSFCHSVSASACLPLCVCVYFQLSVSLCSCPCLCALRLTPTHSSVVSLVFPHLSSASGQWLKASDGSLKLSKNVSSTGVDRTWGPYTRSTLTWHSAAGPSAVFETSYTTFASGKAVMFEQVWVTGAPSLSPASFDDVCGGFPAVSTGSGASDGGVSMAQWVGTFIDDSYKGPTCGQWPAAVRTGLDAGPIALFKDPAADVLILAPASNFMAASFAPGPDADTLAFGPLGSADSIPAGFSVSAVAYLGSEGVSNSLKEWGHSLLSMYGKAIDGASKDFTLNNLGYSTDHGAYYYYVRVLLGCVYVCVRAAFFSFT